MTRSVHLNSLFLLILLSLILPGGQAWGGSPWHWAMTLKQQAEGDPIVRPTDLYIDRSKQQYYVVDSGRNRLISFDRQGSMIHILNAGKALKTPYAITRTEPDGIWLTEKGKNSLTYVDLKGKKVIEHSLTSGGHTVYPDRIESRNGDLFVLDKGTGDILRFHPPGFTVKNRFSCSGCDWGFVDFILYKNRLWALDQRDKKIRIFSLNGQPEKTIALLGGNPPYPVSLAIGPSGFIYILDRHRREVMVYDQQGEFKYKFLRKGIAQGQLYYPIKIRFDPWGRLCVVDEGNARVEIFRR